MISAVKKVLLEGSGGFCFGEHRIPFGASVRRIYVHSDALVDGIQIEYVTESGCAGQMPYLGGTGGRRVAFDIPSGARILGFTVGGSNRVESIKIHTDRGSSPLFGNREVPGVYHAVDAGHTFQGVFGRAGWYLDALGMLLAPEDKVMRHDHLFRLPGMGPATVRVLEEAGLGSCAQLAASDPNRVIVVLRERGFRPVRESVSRWMESAERLAS